jgi:hypothetical protein
MNPQLCRPRRSGQLKDENRLTWKDVLLGEGPRFEIPLPKRGTVKSRKPAVFD